MCNMELNKLFLEMDNVKHYFFEERFYSKKNQVYKVRLQYENGDESIQVLKYYHSNIQALRKEAYMLSLLKRHDLYVPEIYYNGNDYLLMKHLDGKNLAEIINLLETGTDLYYHGEPITDTSVIELLCKWLERFYEVSREATKKEIIFGDIHLRNFILAGQLYGVDFEDYSIGRKEEDCGKLCAYLLTYTPPFTDWKIKFIQKFAHTFVNLMSLDKEFVEAEFKKEIYQIGKRRNMRIPDTLEEVFIFEESTREIFSGTDPLT